MARLTDEQMKQEVKEYVEKFIFDRFPDPLHKELEMQMKEIVFDSFSDGMHFAELQHVGEKKSKIILPGR